jgi:hypothetical protein
MTTITIAYTAQGWTATFKNAPNMPQGVALPLPFSAAARAEIVQADLRKRFPGATITTKQPPGWLLVEAMR